MTNNSETILSLRLKHVYHVNPIKIHYKYQVINDRRQLFIYFLFISH